MDFIRGIKIDNCILFISDSKDTYDSSMEDSLYKLNPYDQKVTALFCLMYFEEILLKTSN